MIQIAPSILSANFAKIEDAAKIAEEAGADLLHIDIMDGHFVPNLTFGPQLVAALKKITSLPLDVHLMVENPRFFIPLFHEAGADMIS
ncbi:MAG: ribulose-phosphate 3-epimerase, partial [Candidatus Aminicenantaceae bacterium]